MTSETLILISSALLSLLFSYIPGLNVKFAELPDQTKKLVMAGMLLIVTGGIFGLACLGVLQDLFNVSITCERESAITLIRGFIFAVMANQGTFKLSPQTQAVKDAKSKGVE